MQSTSNDAEVEAIWPQLVPLLENAMSRLNEKDRTLVALRFFENRSMAETAAVLGINEWAARKRVERALDKLRSYFSKRGVKSTPETIAGALSANSVQAAPAGLAKTISAVALAKGTAASTSTLTLVKGALKLMAWTKTKTAIVGVAIAILGIGATTVAVTALLPAQGTLAPLPKNISIQTPPPDVSSQAAAFSGAWLGAWGHELPGALIVEKISSDGVAHVIYSWGDSPAIGIKAGWVRELGYISNNSLLLATNYGPRISYTLNPDGTLAGLYEIPNTPPSVVMLHRVPSTNPAAIRKAAAERVNFQ